MSCRKLKQARPLDESLAMRVMIGGGGGCTSLVLLYLLCCEPVSLWIRPLEKTQASPSLIFLCRLPWHASKRVLKLPRIQEYECRVSQVAPGREKCLNNIRLCRITSSTHCLLVLYIERFGIRQRSAGALYAEVPDDPH